MHDQVVVVKKFVPLQHGKTKRETENAERRLTPYIIPNQIGKKSRKFYVASFNIFLPHRPPAPFLLINTRSNRCFEPRQIGCTAPKEMLLQAAGKMKRRNSNKMPSGCKREMVSSDGRLKEIRSQRRGKGIVG